MSEDRKAHPGLNLDVTDVAADQKAENDLFGFWVFLMSDAVIFALLFATYGAMLVGTAGGPTPASVYKIGPTFSETLVLLSSSFTFGMAAIAMKYDNSHRRMLGWLRVTLLLGLIFVALEGSDLATMLSQGATPSRSGFLSSFFALVPLHGLHVLAGCLWLVVMMVQVTTIGLDPQVKINILRLGLFWHFLDIVWIAIFSVVYLQGIIA